jgi:hypothetical protein
MMDAKAEREFASFQFSFGFIPDQRHVVPSLSLPDSSPDASIASRARAAQRHQKSNWRLWSPGRSLHPN